MSDAPNGTRRRGAHLAPRRRGRAGILGALLAVAAIVAVVVTAVLSGAGASYALWNGGAATDAGSVNAGYVRLSQQLALPAITYHAGSTTTTGSATVTNTGNVAADFTATVSLGAGSSSALAQAIAVTVWAPSSTDTCTGDATPVNILFSGSMATLVAWTSPLATMGNMPPGGVYLFCVRTVLNVQSVHGVPSGAKVLPTFTTTLTAGSWTDTVVTSTSQNFIDDIAPSIPGPLSSAHTTFAAAVVTWPAATDNVGVTGLTVYRDGAVLASLSPSAVSVTDASVLAGSTHVYTVAAKDAAGNVSTSAPLKVMVPTTDATAWYRVTNVGSGLCVSSKDSGNTDGTVLQQSGCASPTLTSQSWQFQGPNADGYYTVVAHNAPALAWQFGDPGTQTLAVLQTASGTANQQWQALPQGGGRFQYVNRNDGMCLRASGTALQQAACNSADQWQVFQLSTVTALSSLICTAQSTTSVQYSWATPATGDANTAGYAMFVDGQPSNPATIATRDSPYAVFNADYNAGQKTGRVSIEMRQELVSGGEVWIGTGSAIIGTDGSYTCG